ncbi:MAG: SDR family NAD(P)-dependent oxidoreductase [Hyphomicrobiaceae bacterium]
MRHTDKVAIVTGGARGIGFATSKMLSEQGASVVVLDRDAEATDGAVREIGTNALAVVTDLANLDVAAAEDIMSRTIERFGKVDILVNNAGVIHMAPFLDFPAEQFDWVMGVNVRAPLTLSQAAAKRMIAQGHGGAIVNLSSIASELGGPGAAAYSPSKGAIRQLTKVMALELIGHGIRVNAVGPGTIKTDMSATTVMAKDGARTILSRTPAGRFGEPEEIASAISWLASDEASYVVGHTIYVDGGRLILNYTMPTDAT